MSNQGTHDWHVAVWMQLLNAINQHQDKICSKGRRIHSQLVNWQFPPVYNSGTAPIPRYKEKNVRTTEQLQIEREMFTQGDPEQVPTINKNDYRKEKIMLLYWLGVYIFDIPSMESK